MQPSYFETAAYLLQSYAGKCYILLLYLRDKHTVQDHAAKVVNHKALRDYRRLNKELQDKIREN